MIPWSPNFTRRYRLPHQSLITAPAFAHLLIIKALKPLGTKLCGNSFLQERRRADGDDE